MRPFILLFHSSLASLRTSGFVRRSITVAAITLEAKMEDLWPMLVPPDATFCQEWPGEPTMNMVVLNCCVGVFQATSATSEEPPPFLPSPKGS